MSWPSQSESIKALDVSVYQKTSSGVRIDYKELAEENPEIKVIISRLASVWLIKDDDFEYNYDESGKFGFDQVFYVNINPTRSVQFHFDVWNQIRGGREPKLVMFDCEISAGQSPAKIAEVYQGVLDFAAVDWPWASIDIYTAEWYWGPKVKHGWEADHYFHLAHYPYFVQDDDSKWRVAYSYEEVDPLLPINNNFTPRMATGADPNKVIGFQFTSSGQIKGVPKRVDLNYIKKWYYDRVFTDSPPPPPPTEKVPVRIEVPKGKTKVTVIETEE